MGYCAMMRNAHCRIPSAKKGSALAALKALIGSGKETCRDILGQHFSWVESDQLLAAETLEDAIGEWGWKTIGGLSKCPTCGVSGWHGDITGIAFDAEKLGDEAILFGTLAPFVDAGSYIEMEGEDRAVWRYCFDGERMTIKRGKVTFE